MSKPVNVHATLLRDIIKSETRINLFKRPCKENEEMFEDNCCKCAKPENNVVLNCGDIACNCVLPFQFLWAVDESDAVEHRA